MLEAFEQKLREVWDDLTGEARTELETALQDLRDREGKILPILAQFKSDLAAAVAALEPEVKSALGGLSAALIADIEKLLGSGM